MDTDIDVAIKGPRFELSLNDAGYPAALKGIPNPAERLYGIGDHAAMQEGLAVVGARRATPYGIGCAKRFAGIAAQRGICIISGGARGCDSAAHRAALDNGGRTVAFLGGGCDKVYPKQNLGLFQEIVDSGGCVVSEHPFEFEPLPFAFRMRNRLIAGLAKATLIVEAGLPSGTFSTADEALAAGKEVLAVPGSVASKYSRGANRLIYQGATPIVDDDTFSDQLFSIYGLLKQESDESIQGDCCEGFTEVQTKLLEALQAQSLGMEELNAIAAKRMGGKNVVAQLMVWLADMQKAGVIAQYPDGRFGPKVRAVYK